MDKGKKGNTKKHYSKVLKERIAELERDLYKIIDGDIETITIYKIKRKIFTDCEHAMFYGCSTETAKQFNGIITKY